MKGVNIMTYGELLAKLYEMSPVQLQQTVTVLNDSTEEYYGVESFEITEHDDVLDSYHGLLVFCPKEE